MIKTWLITGDTHRVFSRFDYLPPELNAPDTAVIVLGDGGLNYFLDERDNDFKKNFVKKYKMTWYFLHGNHEERPENIPGMIRTYDNNVKGTVWYQPEYPSIKYFTEWNIYNINGRTVGVIGGAYSIDKMYRLENRYGKAGAKYYAALAAAGEEIPWTGWFASEQLTPQERQQCMKEFAGKSFDFILSHTAPLKYEPTHLFLHGIDQTKVDKTMENFLNEIEENIKYKAWLFGHYHADEQIAPKVEIMFNRIKEFEGLVRKYLRN